MFKNQLAYLSNFYPATVYVRGIVYPSSEHAYQAQKTLDPLEELQIRHATSPGRAKRLGSKCTLRSNWSNKRIGCMLLVVYCKFNQHPGLAFKLSRIRDTWLIENNYWHDNFWGNCTCAKCENIKGQNNLGKILSQVKSLLNEEI